MENCVLSFRAVSNGTGLRLTVRLDHDIIFNQLITQDAITVNHEFDDTIQQAHLLEFELSGKQPQHTMLDADNNIIQDLLLTVDNIQFDDISLDATVSKLGKYRHNFNETKQSICQNFYGSMGCNGTLSFEFSSPAYIWLLENM